MTDQIDPSPVPQAPQQDCGRLGHLYGPKGCCLFCDAPKPSLDRDLDEMEAQLDATVPYYVLSLIRELRSARKQLRGESPVSAPVDHQTGPDCFPWCAICRERAFKVESPAPAPAQQDNESVVIDREDYIAGRIAARTAELTEHIRVLTATLREHNEFGALFQPGGRFYGIADLPLGRSAVVEGGRWLVAQYDALLAAPAPAPVSELREGKIQREVDYAFWRIMQAEDENAGCRHVEDKELTVLFCCQWNKRNGEAMCSECRDLEARIKRAVEKAIRNVLIESPSPVVGEGGGSPGRRERPPFPKNVIVRDGEILRHGDR